MNNDGTPSSSHDQPSPSAGEPTLDPSGSPPPEQGQTIAPSSTPSEEQAPIIHEFGDYELTEEIARGGMGVVYRGRQKSLNRDVAIKMILAGEFASQNEVARFYSEAEAAAKLDHPNIVPIYEIGNQNNHHYFSMKLIDGQDLGSMLDQLRNDLPKAVEILAKVCGAVYHAHQRGILHRDLKPANILIDSDGEPYVTDLGLARSMDGDSGLTRTGAVLGTPSYMPPEQAAGNSDITTAADTYSLGAILYEILTGRPPFKASTPVETLMQVINEVPEKPSMSGNVDHGLELICMKCLAKDPNQRYSSADALAQDLRSWLKGDPISVRAPNVAFVAKFWLKQNFGRAAWALVIGPIFGIVSSLSLWYATMHNGLVSSASIYEKFPSVDPPVSLTRMETPAWAALPLMMLFAVAIVFVGFATAVFVRPKNRGADVAAGTIVGVFASLAAFMFGLGANSMMRSLGQDDLHLVREIVRSKGGSVPETLSMRYPELENVEWGNQVQMLLQKLETDFLLNIPISLWVASFVCLGFYFIPCLFETCVAGPILRRYSNAWRAFPAYFEATFPAVTLMTLIALAAGTWLIMGGVGILFGWPLLLLLIAISVAIGSRWLHGSGAMRILIQLLMVIAFGNFFAKDFNHVPAIAGSRASISATRKMMARYPDKFRFALYHAGAVSSFANVLTQMGRFDRAAPLIEKMIVEIDNLSDYKDVDEDELYRNRCKIRLQKVVLIAKTGRVDEAVELFEKTRDEFPGVIDLTGIWWYLRDLRDQESTQ